MTEKLVVGIYPVKEASEAAQMLEASPLQVHQELAKQIKQDANYVDLKEDK